MNIVIERSRHNRYMKTSAMILLGRSIKKHDPVLLKTFKNHGIISVVIDRNTSSRLTEKNMAAARAQIEQLQRISPHLRR